MKEVTKKIVVVSESQPYQNLKRERATCCVTAAEETLFNAIKNVLRKDGIAVTTTVAYYICAVDFGNTYIKSWDKSKYNKIISTDYILKLVNKRTEVFKILPMDR